MAEKKQPSSAGPAAKSAPAGKSAEKADGKKGAMAKAAGGLTAKLSRTGKAAVAKAAEMTATAAKSGKAATSGERGNGRASAAAAPATKAAPRKKTPDLRKDLRDFAAGRPQGWGHDDWLHFLESLRSRGHNIADQEAIGLALERERLDFALSNIKGLGPQRRQALVDRYGTLWALRGADSAEIAKAGNLPADLAQRVKTELPGAN